MSGETTAQVYVNASFLVRPAEGIEREAEKPIALEEERFIPGTTRRGY